MERDGFELYIRRLLVSIPERVWGGLEPAFREIIQPFLLVSIPERVWGGLEQDLL